MEDFKVIAGQYDIDLDKLKQEKGELSFEVLEQYIKEHFYPKAKEERKLSGVRKITAQRLSDSYRKCSSCHNQYGSTCRQPFEP